MFDLVLLVVVVWTFIFCPLYLLWVHFEEKREEAARKVAEYPDAEYGESEYTK